MSKLNVPFNDYLKHHHNNKGDSYTHTRIGDKASKIVGGSYSINDEKSFLERYFTHVFVDKNKEYLTEKQYIENAPLAIDIDMRYEIDTKTRQHTKEHIIDAIDIYAKAISKLYNIENEFKIEVFVMEKPTVNIMDTKTKDGIHIIFGVLMHKGAQVMIRDSVLSDLKEIWDDLPLTNDIDELIDDGVTRGTVNWQMYGSRKPNQAAYLIKYHYELCWNQTQQEWEISEFDINKFNTKKNLHKLSVHCTTFPKLTMKDSYIESFEKIKENLNKKKKQKLAVKTRGPADYNNIKSSSDINNLVEEMLENIEQSATDYELKETHQFTMLLPSNYWKGGSYNKWIRVGWALKNTSIKLLPTWLKFCSQSKEFDWNSIPELIEQWEKFDHDNPDGLTSRSIMYWAKIDNPKEYHKVRAETISYFMEQTVNHVTEWDFAQVLYQMCKDEFICVSIKNNIWYEYRLNIDGMRLILVIHYD